MAPALETTLTIVSTTELVPEGIMRSEIRNRLTSMLLLSSAAGLRGMTPARRRFRAGGFARPLDHLLIDQ